MNLLHIDASVLGDNSVSRKVSAAIVERLRAADPALDVTYRDLAANPLPHLTGLHLAAGQGAAVPAHIQEEHLAAQAALEEFLAADIVVIGAPMYNFTLPTQLKAWVDRILIARKTFTYGPNGVIGLAAGKRVIVAISRGNVYDGAHAAAEHLESYLRTVFGFIGVTDLEFIAADGVQIGPEQREKALKGALEAAGQLRAA
ncbi:MAG TPA: FMN-dependent NADH-azoreductase [Caulobacteraceae bacterium]|nr:FMN-dependent NADH-azoreductase [Caulobacteraceae bacterium]